MREDNHDTPQRPERHSNENFPAKVSFVLIDLALMSNRSAPVSR